MLAKWIIVAFLGFSAVFLTEVRADAGTEEQLPADVAQQVSVAEKNLGVKKVSVAPWMLKYQTRRDGTLRSLKTLGSASFAGVFKALVQSCGKQVDTVELSTSFGLYTRQLSIDVYERNLIKAIEYATYECERTEAAAAGLSMLVGYRVSVSTDRDLFKRPEPRRARFLELFATTRFADALREVNLRCGAKVEALAVDDKNSSSLRSFRLDFAEADPAAYIERKAAECREAAVAIAELRLAMAPRKVRLEPSIVISSLVSSQDLVRWTAAFKAGELNAAVDEFQDSCKFKIKAFELSHSFMDLDDGLALNARDQVAKVVADLGALAASCRRVYAMIPEFNAAFAVKKGLLFKADLHSIMQGYAKPDDIEKWIAFFKESPQRLDDLRNLVMSESRPHEFQQMHECLGKSKTFRKACRGYLIQVEFSSYTGFASTRGLRAVFGALFSVGSLSTLVFETMISPKHAAQGLRDLVSFQTKIFALPVNLETDAAPFVPTGL